MYTKHRFTRESLGRMFSSALIFTSNIEQCLVACSETTTYWLAVGFDGLRVVCNRLNFQGVNREFDTTIWLMQPQKKCIWKWSQPLTTQLWFIATRVRIAHTPLCTISVNEDCCGEFAVCHGVYARSRELNFLTVVLRFYGSQLFWSLWHLDGKSCALFP